LWIEETLDHPEPFHNDHGKQHIPPQKRLVSTETARRQNLGNNTPFQNSRTYCMYIVSAGRGLLHTAVYAIPLYR